MAATPAVLTVAKVTNPWILGGAAAGAAILLFLAGVWQDRYKKIISSRDDISLKFKEECLTFQDGLPPKVRQLINPIALGVHSSIPLTNHEASKGHVPPYVSRDIDSELRAQLLEGGFILIVGDSTAGKSRAAFEAMRQTLHEHTLIAPRGMGGLRVAITYALRCQKAVLWLNDLEFYLRPGGLSREDIIRLVTGDRSSNVVLATIRSAEQDRLLREHSDSEGSGAPTERGVREVFEQAYQIRIRRKFSQNEVGRARELANDSRIAMALQHSGTFGLAEYLAAGPALLRDYENAWDIGVNPRGAALVSAAIDCRRVGFLDSIPRGLLDQLHETYLVEAGGHRLRPESLEDAWEWATRPRYATTALLTTSSKEDAVDVFDYLVDLKQSTQVGQWYASSEFIGHALAYASASDSLALGEHAYWARLLSIGKIAFRRALTLYGKTNDVQGQANAFKGIGDISHAEDDYAEAEKMFQRAWVLYKSINDLGGQAKVARSLSAVAADSDKWAHAVQVYMEIEKLLRSIQDGWGGIYVWNGLSDLFYHKNSYGPHGDLYEVANSMHDSILSWATKAASSDHEPWSKSSGDDVDLGEISELYERIARMYEDIGDWIGQGYAMKVLGSISELSSNLSSAVDYYEKSWMLYRNSATRLTALSDGAVGRSEVTRYCDEYNRIADAYREQNDQSLPNFRYSEKQLEVIRNLDRAARNLGHARSNYRSVINNIDLSILRDSIKDLCGQAKHLHLQLASRPIDAVLRERLSIIIDDIDTSPSVRILLDLPSVDKWTN
ncbi:hypothetical protein [Planobispora takensis]|uniref:Uncharacterized protein n=1 Tax=Planobispora takensis TaxID=1367882 RepID=A0A8J3WU22_9ACTN|nr:hypothetical protein [Planobispora takensis]GII01765.1 hypothetical protein Pta02_37730 [Planobispora takensis]